MPPRTPPERTRRRRRPASGPALARAAGRLVACGLIAGGVAACGGASQPGRSATTGTSALTVIAGDLANPRQLAVGADGLLYVAEAGNGGTRDCATSAGGNRICIGDTGSIARIDGGRAVPVVTGLPSVAAPGGDEASGPADVVATVAGLTFVIQDTDIDRSGANQFGTLGRPLGHLAFAATDGGPAGLSVDFARYEAAHDPDHGAGAPAADAVASDPYGLVGYRGGYAVVDAAANDLLWVDAAGAVHLLAVFPTQSEPTAKAGSPAVAQSVPTSVAVGRDGALYVGELTGAPFKVGAARVWRVVPGRRPTVYASGFTNISAIAFDPAGRLLVLEIDRLGLTDPHGSGELIRVDAAGRRTVLVDSGLVSPTGVAVGADGSIYISDYGSSPSTGPAPHGEILRLAPG